MLMVARGKEEKYLAALKRAEQRGEALSVPRPTKPVRELKPPTIEKDVSSKARKVAEIADRMERRDTLTREERRSVKALLRALPMNENARVVSATDAFHVGAHVAAGASIRDDPLNRLYVQKKIDRAQYLAGRQYQGLLETSEVGRLGAVDTTKEPVDGGRLPEVLTDAQLAASKQLASLSRVLGQEGEALTRAVLGRRQFPSHQRGSQRDTDYRARRFRECLETLARVLGYA